MELIGKEVEKHAGAFTLLAGQASTTDQHIQGQGWTIKELKGEMKEVKDVLDTAVAHIQAWETEAAKVPPRGTAQQPGLSYGVPPGVESCNLSPTGAFVAPSGEASAQGPNGWGPSGQPQAAGRAPGLGQ